MPDKIISRAHKIILDIIYRKFLATIVASEAGIIHGKVAIATAGWAKNKTRRHRGAIHARLVAQISIYTHQD